LLDCRLYLPEEWVNDEAFANNRNTFTYHWHAKSRLKPAREDGKQLLAMGDYEVRSCKRLASPHDFSDVSASFLGAVAMSC